MLNYPDYTPENVYNRLKKCLARMQGFRLKKEGKERLSIICPSWLGHLLVSPLRKWVQDPDKILRPHLAEGMIAVDVGSGMGYFSLPMADLVGESGKVICVDLQEKMLSSLKKRAEGAGVLKRIEMKRAERNSLNLEDKAGMADFVLAFAVVHEMPDPARFFADLARLLRSRARCLVAEPKGHVAGPAFEATLATARQAGLNLVGRPVIRRCRAAVFQKE